MAATTNLPAGLYGLVADRLKRDDLKVLRLTDHAWSDVATVRLFKEIHISPNSSSFDRAHSIAERRHLSQHVRGLVYHFGKLADVYAGFDSFKYEYFANRNGPKSAYDQYELNAELLWNYNCWLEEIDAQRTFELRDEAEELSDLCSHLPRLEAISTILDEAIIFGDQEDYIGKRTGMAAIEDDGWLRFSRLLAAVVDKPLRKISARSIQWHDLDPIGQDSDTVIGAMKTCLGQLRSLEMGIYRTPYDRENDSDGDGDKHSRHVELLNSILGHAHQLEMLRLDFDELPFECDPNETLPVSKAIFSHHWPRLKELKLEALCVYEDELCDFLLGHRTTLTTLCIGDIELASRGDEIPSILSLFLRLHSFLRLKSSRITGNFTNRVNQSWYVDTEHEQSGCLRDQLEDFLCATRTEPLSFKTTDAEEDGSLHSVTLLESYLHMIDGDYEAFEDDSWQWAPELLAFPEVSPSPSSVD